MCFSPRRLRTFLSALTLPLCSRCDESRFTSSLPLWQSLFSLCFAKQFYVSKQIKPPLWAFQCAVTSSEQKRNRQSEEKLREQQGEKTPICCKFQLVHRWKKRATLLNISGIFYLSPLGLEVVVFFLRCHLCDCKDDETPKKKHFSFCTDLFDSNNPNEAKIFHIEPVQHMYIWPFLNVFSPLL